MASFQPLLLSLSFHFCFFLLFFKDSHGKIVIVSQDLKALLVFLLLLNFLFLCCPGWLISIVLPSSLLILCSFPSILLIRLFSSVQFSRSVVSGSLRLHESQHARPPCPSPTPGVHSDSRPSSQSCHPAISSSVIPFSSCPQSLPASESFPMKLPPNLVAYNDKFSSVSQSCPTLCDPMSRSMPGLPIHHQLPEFTQTHVHRVSHAIQPSHPLSSPSPPAPSPSQHQSLFQ